ncbi:E3 ubiquitin-protein ligase ORTHRUS 2-like [Typha latifolia]|uniref:E3 ubiquitin-protein ligase ORTHRUS 2-like n=1 Tax=Typha latifolia TaxID=4733 RepID=UPI003C2E7913
MASDLPCDGEGVCMICKAAAPEAEVMLCRTCATPWHGPCLSKPPETLSGVVDWLCPDCSLPDDLPIAGTGAAAAPSAGASADLIASIRAIEADGSLTEQEKAKRRQALHGGGATAGDDESGEEEEEEEGKSKKKAKASNDVLDLLDEKFNCSFCMQLPERPVTTPCGHNFCLKCFQKWIGQGKLTCAKCRSSIPSKMASQPRINSALVVAIRMAKTAKTVASGGPAHVYHFMRNENRPEKAFTTERAKKAGKANACSGQIFVTVPPDHFGPILAENDPKRNSGVLVGELWEDRMECRQWGAHLPHVAGIAGQSEYGAQSVALSGGYKDDEDHGEWFLYTGSGGRDLSGNKRTNKEQAFDQKFEKLNAALRVSCLKGYPVRVVRSHKEKRSSYAPESGVRYDGIYRIEKCWQKVGIQGFKVCRYLFVRCDNEPAPWTSDEHGDRPRPLPSIKELKGATDITERKESPAWDYEEEDGWKWMKPPPVSRKPVITGNPDDQKRARKAVRLAQNTSVREKLLKEFSCLICRNVMTSPLTTPCAHNFCKSCLLGAFSNQSFVRERTREGGRTLRAQKIIKKCPACPNDISDFIQNPQVNRELMDLIESLKRKNEEENEDRSEVVLKYNENVYDNTMVEKQLSKDESANMESKFALEDASDCVDDKNLNEEESAIGEDNKIGYTPEKGANSASGTGSMYSCKRKKQAVSGPGGKRTKKNSKVDNDGVGNFQLDFKKSGAEVDTDINLDGKSEVAAADYEVENNGGKGPQDLIDDKFAGSLKQKIVKKTGNANSEITNAESPLSPLHVPADDDDSQ